VWRTRYNVGNIAALDGEIPEKKVMKFLEDGSTDDSFIETGVGDKPKRTLPEAFKKRHEALRAAKAEKDAAKGAKSKAKDEDDDEEDEVEETEDDDDDEEEADDDDDDDDEDEDEDEDEDDEE
jgi:hypothetical protein